MNDQRGSPYFLCNFYSSLLESFRASIDDQVKTKYREKNRSQEQIEGWENEGAGNLVSVNLNEHVADGARALFKPHSLKLKHTPSTPNPTGRNGTHYPILCSPIVLDNWRNSQEPL